MAVWAVAVVAIATGVAMFPLVVVTGTLGAVAVLAIATAAGAAMAIWGRDPGWRPERASSGEDCCSYPSGRANW